MEIEWSKWEKDHGCLGPAIVRRELVGKRVEFITAGYVNALEERAAENEVLRKKAELATEARNLFKWSPGGFVFDWGDWCSRYDSLSVTSEGSR